MSLVDSLWKSAAESVLDEEKQADWVSTGFDAALDAARGALPKGESEEVKAVITVGAQALDKLAEHKGSLVLLGKNGLRACLVGLASGQYDDTARKAALVTLREEASWDEVGATILGAAKEGNERTRQILQAQSDILETLKDIGISLARVALPLILSVV